MKFLPGNLNGRDHFGDLDKDEVLILNEQMGRGLD
jgi:hypothetical protein